MRNGVAMVGNAVLAAASLAGPAAVAALSADPPRPGRPVLVLTAPWTGAAEVVRAAGGTLLPGGAAGFAALAFLDAPDVAARLAAAGAWVALDGTDLASICGVAE